MKKIIGTVIMVLVLVWVLPWSRISWGKITLQPSEVVTVTGEANTVEKNQLASFTAGVEAVNDNKDMAVDEVNKKVNDLIAAVKGFGIGDEDVQTQSISIYQSEESYFEGGVRKTRKGQWRVNNSIEITLRNIDRASELTDLLSSSGATNIYGPNFRMDEKNDAEKGLYEVAMKDAREKAESIARASGRKLGKVLSVNDGGTANTYPVYARMDMVGAGGGAPLEPGSSTVYKSMTVSFELK